MAAALTRSRDAIVGAELVKGAAGENAALGIGKRFKRLDADHRAAILASELLEDISFTSVDDPHQPVAMSVTLRRKQATTGQGDTDLVTIKRPGLAEFSAAIPLVAAYAELRPDRSAEILAQTDQLVPFFASIMPMDSSRSPALLEVLSTALDMATFVVMRVKLLLGCPRPGQFSDRIQPMIPCPTHATLPSGHSTQAFTLATVLTLMNDPGADVAPDSQLYRLACRIAINRTVAGVHFPVDSAAGAILGIQLGRYLVARVQDIPGAVGSASFDGALFKGDGHPPDFHYAILNRMLFADNASAIDQSTSFTTEKSAVRPAPIWASLWTRASEEWEQRWS